VQAVRAAQPGPAADQPLVLPGSPWLITHQLRSQDAIRCCEAHPTDFPLLQAMLAPLGRRAQALQKDGFESLKAWLPPASRRGLVLMDPSYELKSDYPQALKSLRNAVTRFATGCYVIWVPMVARLEVDRFVRQAMALPAGSRLLVSLKVRSPVKDGLGLMGSHLVILNPPFGLQTSLEEALPWLVKQLGQDGSARFELSQQETGGPKPPRPTTPRSTGRAAPSRPGSLKRLS
jgi:23S rRNA (adenine2030-N6)-methyltransferase